MTFLKALNGSVSVFCKWSMAAWNGKHEALQALPFMQCQTFCWLTSENVPACSTLAAGHPCHQNAGRSLSFHWDNPVMFVIILCLYAIHATYVWVVYLLVGLHWTTHWLSTLNQDALQTLTLQGFFLSWLILKHFQVLLNMALFCLIWTVGCLTWKAHQSASPFSFSLSFWLFWLGCVE